MTQKIPFALLPAHTLNMISADSQMLLIDSCQYHSIYRLMLLGHQLPLNHIIFILPTLLILSSFSLCSWVLLQIFLMATKISKAANWTRSCMSQLMLQDLVKTGILPAEDQIEWRAHDEAIRPALGPKEVVIFVDHLDRGFRLQGSKFFRDILHFFNIRPKDLAPN